MKNTLKKLLSLIMVIILIFSATPLSGFVGIDLPNLFSIETKAATYSGTCGANVRWSLNTSTGVLSITGSGAMANYDDLSLNNNPPWYSYRYETNITSVKIANGVTSIGDSAFKSLDITSVTIPNSVKSIGNSAFRWCYKITSISIPNSVTYIGDSAFCYCESLRTITIPNSVTNMGAGIFANCKSLRGIVIPDSVTTIGVSPFSRCTSLTQIAVSSNNKCYSNDSYGVLFNKNKTELIQYPVGNTRTSYTIPNSVTVIGSSAFNSAATLSSITIPYSVTDIGAWAFENCEKIQSVTIPDSVETIGVAAFGKCYALKTVTIGNSVTSIDNGTFQYCKNLKNVTIGSSVQSIGYMAFSDCKKIQNINIPDSVTHIDGYAFSGCVSLESIILPKELETIESGAFNRCTSLKYVHIPLNLKNIEENILVDTSAHICSTTENSYAKTYADKNNIEFKKCNGHAISVFSTSKSFSVKTGESMWLAFGWLVDDKLDGEWKKMAITVSDPTVISLSDYEKTKFGYSIEVIGKKEGITNLTISDTTTGANTTIAVTVSDSYNKTYSYDIENMPVFYPDYIWEKNIATNIYNANGIYVKDYNCTKNGDKYNISFNAYNEQFHTAAVDIYDAEDNWLGSEKIDKYSEPTSIWDTGKQVFYFLVDLEHLSYTHAAQTKKTSVSFEVPDGGYFVISNNYADSPGCFIYNTADIYYEGISAALDIVTGNVETPFSDLLMGKIKDSKITRELFMDIFKGTADNEIRKYCNNIVDGSIDSSYSGLSKLFHNILLSLDIEWEHLFSTASGIGESVFKKISGPFGLALEGCFGISEATNKLLQAMDIAWSTDEPYTCVYSDIDEGYINPHGVIVNTNGNTDAETVLQVFRISNNDSVKVILNSDNPLEMHELYNICFVKDDKLVQPNGKVKVHVPIPAGMDSDTCVIYRQEENGSWTILDGKVEGNYLVFETEHFSLYAIVGEKAEIEILSLPEKLTYTVGDNLDLSGLSLKLNGETISSGLYCDPSVLYKPGTQKITIKYGNTSTDFDVTVTAKAPEISTPSTTKILHGETLVLKLEDMVLPEGYFVDWSANSDVVTIALNPDDCTECYVTSVASGNVTVTAKLVDENREAIKNPDGEEIFDEFSIESRSGFFLRIISFFKNLFRINRIIY